MLQQAVCLLLLAASCGSCDAVAGEAPPKTARPRITFKPFTWLQQALRQPDSQSRPAAGTQPWAGARWQSAPAAQSNPTVRALTKHACMHSRQPQHASVYHCNACLMQLAAAIAAVNSLQSGLLTAALSIHNVTSASSSTLEQLAEREAAVSALHSQLAAQAGSEVAVSAQLAGQLERLVAAKDGAKSALNMSGVSSAAEQMSQACALSCPCMPKGRHFPINQPYFIGICRQNIGTVPTLAEHPARVLPAGVGAHGQRTGHVRGGPGRRRPAGPGRTGPAPGARCGARRCGRRPERHVRGC